jgi:hypothetical protein
VTPDGARALGGLVILVLLAIAAWLVIGLLLYWLERILR